MSKKKNMYKLESLARLISGRTPEREQKEYYAETGTPWVKIENLDQGYIRETAEYLSEQGKEKVNLVPENSVLFSIVGTVGKFISATHIGITSNPSFGQSGEKWSPPPSPSNASESFPCRSITVVKSYFKAFPPAICLSQNSTFTHLC